MSSEGQTKLWYFENFNFLKSLSKSEKMDLSNCSVMKEATKNQVIYLPHDISSRIYFLKEGKVKVASYSEDGREMIHAILGAGEIFGELALAGEESREQYAKATEDVVYCQISVPEFEEFLKRNPSLNLEVTKLIGFRLKRISSRLERMWFKSAPDRVRYLLKELADDHGKKIGDEIEVKLNLTHQELASLAATTRQTVTTTLNDLEKKGVIIYDRRRILVKKYPSLTSN